MKAERMCRITRRFFSGVTGDGDDNQQEKTCLSALWLRRPLASRKLESVLRSAGSAVAFALGLNIAMAAPVTIYSNDFEAYSGAATSLEDVADADPTGDEWMVTDDDALNPNTPGMGVQVINWRSHSGNQALLFRSSSEAQIHFPGPRSGTRYQLDFWLWVEKGSGDRNFYFIMQGEGADYNGSDYVAYRSDRGTTAKIFYYDGVDNNNAGLWVGTPGEHREAAWQHHRWVIRPNELKMDIYLDDMENPVVADVDLARCEVAVPTLLIIRHEGNSGDDGFFILDDVSFEVEGSVDLTKTFFDSFEDYPARTTPEDDADPQGPWITVETDGTGTGRALAPNKVQVVDSSVVKPRTGNKCLKLEGGQRAGVSIAWGVPPQRDVQITWWARVPESQPLYGAEANYLRMSLYGAENRNNLSGDNALLGYGIRNASVGRPTSLTYYTTGWVDSGVDFTPDAWEQYRLITHTAQGLYTIIKNPDSPTAEVVVDRAPFIGSAALWTPVFMAGWSSSNGTNHPPVYVDDIEIKSLVVDAPELGPPYTPTVHGTTFTNITQLEIKGRIVGRPVVDPRDNRTIIFAVDAPPADGGGIYKATHVSSGNWVVDANPIVSGLDRPSGLAVTADGTIWWTHDYNNDLTRSVGRLRWPWNENTPETIIADVGDPAAGTRDDDAIDLCVAPGSFDGSIGHPGWIVVADRGVDGDASNAVYVIDPTTTDLDRVGYDQWLVAPTATDLGGNLMAIDALPQTGEVVVLSQDGFIVAIDANGSYRYVYTVNLWPLGATATGAALAVEPTTGRIWVADDALDEIWSVDPSSGEDRKEISFPLTIPSRPDRQIDLHDPGMAFAPDGSMLVVSDASVANGGGRLIIFHNQASTPPSFAVTRIERGATSVKIQWQAAGTARYDVLRSTNLSNPAGFTAVATDLTDTSYTDTNPPAEMAFYIVVAKP
ncbi:MAG TPA: hypothetical protein PLW35_01485 [Verrucomicrobiota bacterium]|nr:hypothetical protein [Verrucomicrobiota bacterium]